MVDQVSGGGAPISGLESGASLNQSEFLRLFVKTLQTQDPTQPVDQQTFLAQLAQFASLEQSRQTNESLEQMVFASATSQAVGLIGKRVELAGRDSPVPTPGNDLIVGKVTAVEFTPTGPMLTLDLGDNLVKTGVRLSEIRRVLQPTATSQGITSK